MQTIEREVGGDVFAVKPPNEKAYLAKVLYVEGGARFSDPNFCRILSRAGLPRDEHLPELDH